MYILQRNVTHLVDGVPEDAADDHVAVAGLLDYGQELDLAQHAPLQLQHLRQRDAPARGAGRPGVRVDRVDELGPLPAKPALLFYPLNARVAR